LNQRIVAIGGGSLGFGGKKPEVLPLSREILRLSGRKNPNLLFVPTASSDDRAYVRMVEGHFGARLGCRVETLYLCREKPALAEIRRRVRWADIVYVGGGNTLMMMNRWKRLGMDRALREARRKGKVLCGTSAGALCWFRQGNSDSRKYYDPKAGLIRVSGLGFFPALGCPHYDAEMEREPQLREMMRTMPGVALALDNGAALEAVGERGRILASLPGAGGWKVYWKKGRYHREKLAEKTWMGLKRLFSKPS
jgi:dipeptidase E